MITGCVPAYMIESNFLHNVSFLIVGLVYNLIELVTIDKQAAAQVIIDIQKLLFLLSTALQAIKLIGKIYNWVIRQE